MQAGRLNNSEQSRRAKNRARVSQRNHKGSKGLYLWQQKRNQRHKKKRHTN
ncbi:unnamed protein product [marine sediment metagenome]|uniref:Uncharacterized protein n=1 Tax=marine sediment metagenome TaxID=412755 RepID=X1PXR7_9ZZZZ